MIARHSTSYPYLAIAKHFDVPYAQVLAMVDTWEAQRLPEFFNHSARKRMPSSIAWEEAVAQAILCEHKRREQ